MGRESHEFLPLAETLVDRLRGGQDVKDLTTDDRYRIRDRLHHTIVNGDLLFWHLSPGERGKIFDMTKSPTAGSTAQIQAPAQSDALKEDYKEFHTGAKDWLAFLYAGITEAGNIFDHTNPRLEYNEDGEPPRQLPNARFDFTDMLETAVRDVARQRGERVTSFELNIETEPATPADISEDFDTEDLLARFEEGDLTLTMAEIEHLRREKGVTYEEYRERAYEDIQPPEPGATGAGDDIIDAPDGTGGGDGEG